MPRLIENGHFQSQSELHAALALVAYGAFALAAVAGVMYVVQEKLLKKHRLNSFFHILPPIAELSVALQRVLSAQ